MAGVFVVLLPLAGFVALAWWIDNAETRRLKRARQAEAHVIQATERFRKAGLLPDPPLPYFAPAYAKAIEELAQDIAASRGCTVEEAREALRRARYTR